MEEVSLLVAEAQRLQKVQDDLKEKLDQQLTKNLLASQELETSLAEQKMAEMEVQHLNDSLTTAKKTLDAFKGHRRMIMATRPAIIKALVENLKPDEGNQQERAKSSREVFDDLAKKYEEGRMSSLLREEKSKVDDITQVILEKRNELMRLDAKRSGRNAT